MCDSYPSPVAAIAELHQVRSCQPLLTQSIDKS